MKESMKGNEKKAYRWMAAGLVMGLIIGLSTAAIAASGWQITATSRPDIQYVFDGEIRRLPQGYHTLVYEGRTYLPVRFVAENMGHEVLWDDVSQRVLFTSPEPVVVEVTPPAKEEPQPEQPSETEEKEEAAKPEKPVESSKQPAGSYRRLPITQYHEDLELTVEAVVLRDTDTKWSGGERVETTRVYVRIENEGDTHYEIRQGETVAIVDGKTYKSKDVLPSRWDPKWFTHMRKDDVIRGYFALPDLPEDAKEMRLTIVALEQSFRQKEHEITFDIALDLK